MQGLAAPQLFGAVRQVLELVKHSSPAPFGSEPVGASSSQNQEWPWLAAMPVEQVATSSVQLRPVALLQPFSPCSQKNCVL